MLRDTTPERMSRRKHAPPKRMLSGRAARMETNAFRRTTRNINIEKENDLCRRVIDNFAIYFRINL